MTNLYHVRFVRGVARGRVLGCPLLPLCEIMVLCPYNSGGENARIRMTSIQ